MGKWNTAKNRFMLDRDVFSFPIYFLQPRLIMVPEFGPMALDANKNMWITDTDDADDHPLVRKSTPLKGSIQPRI